MIRVDRSLVPAPDVLTKAGLKGDVERKAAIAFFSNPDNLSKAFKTYDVYKHDDVKEALKKLFNNKCAFCEIDYGGSPWAIEHFRPKGSMHELDLNSMLRLKGAKEMRPGYYWLAAEWTNLLTSCTDCNSPRRHKIGTSARKRTAGKATFFPLEAGSPRARSHGDGLVPNERPLLIDPTVDDPAAHLKFGEGGVIVALTERGRVTVGVLGLQRFDLVGKREGARILLRNLIDSVNEAKDALKQDPANGFARSQMTRHLAIIRDRYLADTSPFLAMNRQLVRELLTP